MSEHSLSYLLFEWHIKTLETVCTNVSRIIRKSAFCICKNKCADQLSSDRVADQHLSFCFKTNPPPPLQNVVLGGYTVSACPSFCDFVIPRFCDHFLRFCSVTLVALAQFCSNFHHTLTIKHCMFCRKIGAEGSVLQELCYYVILTARCLPLY